MKRVILLLLLTVWIVAGLIILNHQDMRLTAKGKISHDPANYKEYKTLVVLGAGRNYTYARPNYAFIGRMDAAAMYIKNHPDVTVILSGMSDGNLYNEPMDMLHAIQLRGVKNFTYEFDDHSIDTYSSIQHYKEKFGNEPMVLISQEEHLIRAVWMARNEGIEAVGFAAKGFPGGTPRWFLFREYAASVKARLREIGILSATEI